MRSKMLVILATSALLVMACNVSGLVTQFLPQKEIADAKATLEAVGPTLQAVATTGVPTIVPGAPKAGASTGKGVEPTRPAISSSGSTGGILADALAKVRTAPKFRVEFSFLFGVTESSKYQEQTFIDLTGQADNGKAQVTLKGVLMAMLSGDLKTPVEIITADGKSYLRGVSMFGMTDPKVWYVTDDSSAGGFGDFAKPEGFEDWLGDTDPADFKKVRTESLDNQSCDVYVNNVKSMDAVPFLKIAADFQDQADMSVLDKGEMSLWLCRDGYVHKFFLDFQGHNQSSVAEKGAIKMLWHAWDYGNSAISITLPKDAKPMPGQ